jgi:hypothetical protein
MEVHDYIGSLLDAGKQTDVSTWICPKPLTKLTTKFLIHKFYNCFGISGSLLAVGSPPNVEQKATCDCSRATSSENL